jgi:hypothetical protein
MTLEQGKPLAEAIGEVPVSLSGHSPFFVFYATTEFSLHLMSDFSAVEGRLLFWYVWC